MRFEGRELKRVEDREAQHSIAQLSTALVLMLSAGISQDPMREASLEKPSSWVGNHARGSRVRFKQDARRVEA